MPFSETELLRLLIEDLRKRLPPGWTVEESNAEPRTDDSQRPDAILDLSGPDGKSTSLVLEVKSRVDARDIAAVVYQLRRYTTEWSSPNLLVVAPFLSDRARQRLREESIGYADATGNFRLALAQPALFVETSGADRDPWPEHRGLRSFKRGIAARAVRAYCDFRPPYGIRQLAQASETSAPTLSRVADILTREDIITWEKPRGRIAAVDWQALLRRWSQDYRLVQSNRVKNFLDPRGLNMLTSKLKDSNLRYAITGSFAAVRLAPIVEARLAVIYVPDSRTAADRLGLRMAETGANVILAEPFDDVVFERARYDNGIVYANASQVAADLLTGTGRNPAEAEALMEWMTGNEDSWRTPISIMR